VSRVGTSGSLLGILDTTTLEDSHLLLEPGDVLVLHTDGVTEARKGSRYLDPEGLDELILARPVDSARQLADRIIDHVVAFQDNRPRDDIALVVVRVPVAGSPGRHGGSGGQEDWGT
jgi:sigma-B regulation protein RsbU (phosphoserine phosphatase)